MAERRRGRGAGEPDEPADEGRVTLALQVEAELLSSIMLEPARLDEALELCIPEDLQDTRHVVLFRSICEFVTDTRAGEPIDLVGLCERMANTDALERAGGAAYISEVLDYAASAEIIPSRARIVRRRRIERSIALEIETLPRARETEELGEALARIDSLRQQRTETAPLDLARLGFSGDRLRELRTRPEAVSPLPGLLDPEPHLHMLQGRPKSAKTTLALKVARDWAIGARPWPGAPDLPGSRVLIVSREQTAKRLDATLLRLSVFAERDEREVWTDRMPIIARDSELPREARALLTLDTDGLAALRRGLLDARRASQPYGLVILDSLSRLKPPEIEEDKSDHMSPWLDRIEDIAVDTGAYILMIHHAGHSVEPTRGEARSAGRGSSAIQAVAHAMWLLERVASDPRQRRLKVDGNNILPREITFEVCGATAEPGTVNYFRLSDPVAEYPINTYIQPGEEMSTTVLAFALTGQEPPSGDAKPSGSALRNARTLMEAWQRQRLGEVRTGARGARIFYRFLTSGTEEDEGEEVI